MTDYKKYINALRKCAKEHKNDRTFTGHIIVSDLCRDTANLLESLEQEPKWIPVSERLPEELNGVLVYCPTNNNIFCAYLEKGIWKIFSPIALEDIKEIVTAWMPLPEPYKAERGGEE